MTKQSLLICNKFRAIAKEVESTLTFEFFDDSALLETLEVKNAAAMIIDYQVLKQNQLWQKLRRLQPQLILIPVIDKKNSQAVVDAFQSGAFDVLLAPVAAVQLTQILDKLQRFVEHQARFYSDNREIENLDEPVSESRAMQKTLQQLQKLQSSRLPLLLIGETGTGKNVLANYRHRHSERRGEPFLTVNCGALSPTLLESELFGYEKGAFTGAVQRRVGLLEAADGGTLFLDEINSASTELQVRLLQFIQDQTLLRVGARSEIKVDVQLVFATNQDLRPLVDKGAFREDLFFRLNVFPIEIPPLRERLEDISHLAARFLFKHAPQVGKRVESCAPGVLDAMLNYSWPGNVRELENVVLRMLISAQGERIELFDLPPEIIQVRKETNTNLVTPHPLFPQYASLQEIEKIWIEYTLKKFQGNKLRAADALGINSTTLWRKLKQSR